MKRGYWHKRLIDQLEYFPSQWFSHEAKPSEKTTDTKAD
jgi:hypothetical protein